MFTMPMAPLVVNQTSGDWMWTAASVLGLHTSQKLAFDPSLDIDFDAASQDVKDSGLSMLERYVSRLLDASFADSSTFWHYAMRHVPSASLTCAMNLPSNQKPAGAKMSFANDAELPADIQEAFNHNATIPAYGYAAFPLGGAKSMCFCGWSFTAQKKCQVPDAICLAVKEATTSSPCTYDPATQEGRDFLAVIMGRWTELVPSAENASTWWPCPETDLSDAWGIASAYDSDAWIQGGNSSAGVRMSMAQLLRAGRAGMRIGNTRTLSEDARHVIHPMAREEKLLPSDDSSSTGAALQRCSDTILESFDATSVVKEVADDLFPVAQGIHESAPISVCLRYAIEFSRLRMLRAIQSVAPLSAAHLRDELSMQKSVADRWKGRCESQLNMLAVCKSNGLFDLVPKKEFAYDCPFVISDSYAQGSGQYYVTPTSACLLYYKGSFYNPCRHSTRPCKPASNAAKVVYTLAEITGASQKGNTLVKFDVRSTGSGEILGTWPIKFYDLDPAKNEVSAQVVARIMRWQVGVCFFF